MSTRDEDPEKGCDEGVGGNFLEKTDWVEPHKRVENGKNTDKGFTASQ